MDWPFALPPLPIDVDAMCAPNVIATEVDHGPKKRRRRYTAVEKPLSIRNWHLKGDDFDTLFHFYETDTRSGADAFTMPRTISGLGAQEVRFASELRWRVVRAAAHAGERLISCDFDLEVMP